LANGNPPWGAPRIQGELLKLGFEVSERTVPDIMVNARRPSALLHAIRTRELTGLCVKRFLRCWELIRVSRDPYVKRREKNNADHEVGNQAAHDYDGEGPLRV
jgi:hypothetical protein